MKSRTKAFLIVGVGVAGLIAALGGIKVLQFRSMKKAGESFRPPPEAVTSARVEATDWPHELRSVGSIAAMQSVTIAPEVTGTIVEIRFESGDLVKRGDVLVRLDDSTERAQLESARARASLAEINRKRASALRTANVNTEAELDAAVSGAREAKANVADIRAAIAKKQIRAPFAGRLGIRRVDVGQVLAAGDPIVQLTQYDPIFTDFFLPQRTLSKLSRDPVVEVATDAFRQSWTGRVSAIDSEVDPSTRNIKIRATFTNSGERLRPGMFVDVVVRLPEKNRVLIIPASAVIRAPYGDSVFVIEKDKQQLVAKQRFVRVGERRGDLVAIRSGLEAGEIVVTTGGFKLKSGTPVAIDNSLAPKAKAEPKPRDM